MIPTSPHRPSSTLIAVVVAVMVVMVGASCTSTAPPEVFEAGATAVEVIQLPAPELTGSLPVEEALAERRSVREYSDEPLRLATVGQLLWAGQGITDDQGRRAAPSAGGRYPLELFVVSASGVDQYRPAEHVIDRRTGPDLRAELGSRAFGQDFVADAPIVIVVAAVFERTEIEYGAAAHDLVNREAGHATQNILLQAVALDLVAVPVGGFDPADVAELLALPPEHEVLYLIPVGWPR